MALGPYCVETDKAKSVGFLSELNVLEVNSKLSKISEDISGFPSGHRIWKAVKIDDEASAPGVGTVCETPI